MCLSDATVDESSPGWYILRPRGVDEDIYTGYGILCVLVPHPIHHAGLDGNDSTVHHFQPATTP